MQYYTQVRRAVVLLVPGLEMGMFRGEMGVEYEEEEEEEEVVDTEVEGRSG